jgi:hypothetical protein
MVDPKRLPASDDVTIDEQLTIVAWLRRRHPHINILRANLYVERLVAFCERRQRKLGAKP